MDKRAVPLLLASPPKPTRILQVHIPPRLGADDTVPSSHSTPVRSVQLPPADLTIATAISDSVPGVPHRHTRGTATPQLLTPEICSPAMTTISTSNLEGELLDQALESVLSLPQVCHQVALQQRDQCVELKHQSDILAAKQGRLKAVKEARDDAKEEVESLQRKVYLTQDSLHLVRIRCKQLEKENDSLVGEQHTLELNLSSSRADQKGLSALFDRYKCKMSRHRELVEVQEQTSHVYKRLVEHREKVDTLKTQKEALDADPDKVQRTLGGDYETQLHTELLDHQDQISKLEDQAKALQDQITSEREEQDQLKNSTDVLHKRNAAQLTRLRKRLHEAHARNKHWRDQAAQLQAKIDQLTNQNN